MDDLNNQTTQLESQTDMESPPASFLAKNKKIILLVLALILVVESIWAISFIRSTKKTVQPGKPRVKIASLSLEPNLTEAVVSQEFTVYVQVDTTSREINGIDSIILYDPEFLEVVDSDNQTPGTQVTPGDLFGNLLVNETDPTVGKIVLTASRLSKNTEASSGKGTVALITFIPKRSGETDLTILFDPERTDTSNVTEAKTSNNILTTVADAKVKISQ